MAVAAVSSLTQWILVPGIDPVRQGKKGCLACVLSPGNHKLMHSSLRNLMHSSLVIVSRTFLLSLRTYLL